MHEPQLVKKALKSLVRSCRLSIGGRCPAACCASRTCSRLQDIMAANLICRGLAGISAWPAGLAPRAGLPPLAAAAGQGPTSSGDSQWSQKQPWSHSNEQQRRQLHGQQHQDYSEISSGWQVRRTPLHHYPLETQDRIRRGIGRNGASAPASGSGFNAMSAEQEKQQQPLSLAAELELLQRVLEWEAAHNCPNAAGSRSGQLAATFAAAVLHRAAAAAQVAAQAEDLAGERGLEDISLTAAQQCTQAAADLQWYESMSTSGRQQAVERAQAAAAMAQHTLEMQQRSQAQPHQPTQPRKQWFPSTGVLQGPALPEHVPPPMSAQHTAGRRAATASAAAAASAAASVQQPPQVIPLPTQSVRSPSAALDAEAAAAHEEETAEVMQLPPSAGSAAPREDHMGLGAVADALAAAALPARSPPRRAVKAQTVAFRQSFAEAACAFQAQQDQGSIGALSGGAQRSKLWLQLRERRLTASAFSSALGFFEGDRERLWEEKVGLRAPFAGNEATRWGTRAEAQALAAYQALTGQRIEDCMFKVKHEDVVHGWLGASPDGLIPGISIHPSAGPTSTASSAVAGMPVAAAQWPVQGTALGLARGEALVAGEGGGILEVKCPFNKGRPEEARPPRTAIWYYMPQVQGLMEIFDRQWCNLYVWTPRGGSGLYHIRRDPQYWSECFEVLAEFWWNHVVPARQAVEAGESEAAVEQFRPAPSHPLSKRLKERSKTLALAAPATFFPSLPPTALAE